MNEVVIISERLDKSTDLVIEWLTTFGCNVQRINYEDANDYHVSFFVENGFVQLESKITEKIVLISNMTVVWHRRGYIPFRPKSYRKTHHIMIEGFLENDIGNAIKGIDLILQHTAKYYIGSWFKEKETYKILNLHLAKKAGFKIPKTIVTNCKTELQAFKDEYENIISKGLDRMILFTTNEFSAGKGTFMVTQEMIDTLPSHFEPTLFQNCIYKLYEVRIFIFDTHLFSMAIFSYPFEGKTRVDVREDIKERPNRCIPYILPKTIDEQIRKFMKFVDMKTGSIDLIVGTDQEYYFLEVNPMGQFDWVSGLCNYNIEYTIANLLTQKCYE
ncbi:hypothetical protein EZY14_012875 [Kordia sp. TARA_039_SRF]|nr:hypothetical protein EZY14_012875 [Kordia sp. TARA_039_SRF]